MSRMRFARWRGWASWVILLTLASDVKRGATLWGAPVDSGQNPQNILTFLANETPQTSGLLAGWSRYRGIYEPGSDVAPDVAAARVAQERTDLLKAKAAGIRPVVLLYRDSFNTRWPGGVRSQSSAKLPLDLRDAYARAKWLGANYGDVVAAWEVDNEPDLGFVAENAEHYAAYLKAFYLGLKHGVAESFPHLPTEVSGTPAASLILMAPVGLPPGTWLERFAANDGLSYTDGYNYHYYGYAADFTDVYWSHERAVKDLAELTRRRDSLPPEKNDPAGNRSSSPMPARNDAGAIDSFSSRSLPIFITEIGYGMLGRQEATTKAGRLRQWRWFRDVRQQIVHLRPEAPMAFYLPPYLEFGSHEYGLTVPATVTGEGEAVVAAEKDEVAQLGRESWKAGEITYALEDFGVRKAQPWMELIGQKVRDDEITPALAYWWRGLPKDVRAPIPWTVSVAKPSSIVVDFVAKEHLTALKRYNAYSVNQRMEGEIQPATAGKRLMSQVGREVSPVNWGRGEVVVYNFSHKSVVGQLCFSAGFIPAESIAGSVLPSGEWVAQIELAAMERRVIEVEVRTQRGSPMSNEATIRFQPESGEISPARFVTAFMPPLNEFKWTECGSLFDLKLSRISNERKLRKRMLVAEEDPKISSGIWFHQEGATVEPIAGGYIFRVKHAAPGKVHRVEVELPWPDELKFSEDSFLNFFIRSIGPEGAENKSGQANTYGVQIRTQNGNVYEPYSRREATSKSTSYFEPKSSFSLSIYGRAKQPWRFEEEVPLSIIFVLYARNLPAVYEVRFARVFHHKPVP